MFGYLKKLTKKALRFLGLRKKADSVILGGLREAFAPLDFKLLDVGARGKVLERFKAASSFGRLFLCEPDPAALGSVCDRARAEGWREVAGMPEGLSANPNGKLFVTRNQASSSLLPPNEKIVKLYAALPEDFKVTGELPISLLTLDGAARKYDFLDLSVIKLDTQGTELPILKSGPRVLQSLSAIYTEAEFVPFYRNEALFGELNVFLEGQGFRLMEMRPVSVRRRVANPPAYSRPEMAWGYALYLRERNADGSAFSVEQTLRLVATAVIFRFFDYAIYLLEDHAFRFHFGQEKADVLIAEIQTYAKVVSF